MICAARYACEKQSHMTGAAVRFMRDSLHRMSVPSLQTLDADIRKRLVPMHYYKREWTELLDAIGEEIKRRDTGRDRGTPPLLGRGEDIS